MPNWSDVLNEIGIENQKHQFEAQNQLLRAQGAIHAVRQKYLKELHDHTSRNVIAYYSGFLSKPEIRSDINDEDKNGFMMAVHRMQRLRGLDLILHTPGGNIGSTQSVVHYLRQMFDNDIRAIIPQIAMSAGTMIACSCKEIVMGKHSNLGPIDPHLNGVPAYGVIEEFNRAMREVKEDPSRAMVWQSIMGQYRPTFLSQCENAIAWSNRFVATQLQSVMFQGTTAREKRAARIKASQIVKKLTDYRGNKTHNRHIHLQELSDMGLKIVRLEEDEKLQDLVLTVHHCYMHTLMNTPAYKIIENQRGAAMIKQQHIEMKPGSARWPSPSGGELTPLSQPA
jgi:ClpP class serine protease